MSKTEWLLLAVILYLLFFRSKGQAAAGSRPLTEDEIAERNLSADGLTPQHGCSRSDGVIGCYVGGGIPLGSPLY